MANGTEVSFSRCQLCQFFGSATGVIGICRSANKFSDLSSFNICEIGGREPRLAFQCCTECSISWAQLGWISPEKQSSTFFASFYVKKRNLNCLHSWEGGKFRNFCNVFNQQGIGWFEANSGDPGNPDFLHLIKCHLLQLHRSASVLRCITDQLFDTDGCRTLICHLA